MATIRELIASLQTIEDKSQVYAGAIWIAEDFTLENMDGEEIAFTPDELSEVIQWRNIEKSIGFTYDEIYEALSTLKREEN
jgi:hypothetical protein